MAKEIGTHNVQNQVNAQPARRSWFKRISVVLVPLLIVLGFVFATQAMVKAFDKPKEKERSFNTLAVRGDYAKRGDVVLTVETQGEARPRTEIDLVPEVGAKILKSLARVSQQNWPYANLNVSRPKPLSKLRKPSWKPQSCN